MKKFLFLVLLSLGIQASNLGQKALNESLFNAIKEHNLDQVRDAINAGADINAEIMNQPIFSWAILYLDQQEASSSDIAILLIDKGARVNPSLIEASFAKGISRVAVKIAERCNVDFLIKNYHNHYGRMSILDYICSSTNFNGSDINSLLYLLEKGINFNGYTEVSLSYGGPFMKMTVMQYVIRSCDANQNKYLVIQKLIDRGYKVNDAWPMSIGSPETIKLFLKNGADVNHVFSINERQYTPLLYAIVFDARREDVIKTLLSAGADINKRGKVGVAAGHLRNVDILGEYTPLELAFKLGNPKLVELLTGSNS